MYYRQVTSEQRSQIFVPSQKKTAGKKIRLINGRKPVNPSRELGRNETGSGKHLWNKARGMAMARRRRTTENSRKDSIVVQKALEHVRRDDRSPKQVAST